MVIKINDFRVMWTSLCNFLLITIATTALAISPFLRYSELSVEKTHIFLPHLHLIAEILRTKSRDTKLIINRVISFPVWHTVRRNTYVTDNDRRRQTDDTSCQRLDLKVGQKAKVKVEAKW